jgi:peptide/nickel transport system permease protein
MSLDASAPQFFQPLAPVRRFLQEVWHDKGAAFGLLVIVLIVLSTIFAPFIVPYDPAAQDLAARLAPPFWLERGTTAHLLGTDHLGRDILSRIIYGGRASLLVAACVVFLAGSFGTIMGLWAGFMGGRADAIIMRLVDIQVALPGLLLILLVISVVGAGIWTMIVVLAIANWMLYARLVRSMVLSLRQMEYIEAAEMIGCRPSRVVFRHVLPNLVSPLLTLAILEFTNIILAEAALSFLGLGVQPPATSWGLDVSNGKDYLFVAWWLVTFPGLCISITVIAINLFANWVRVTTDPQEREKRYARYRARARMAKAAKAARGAQQ